MRIFKFKVIPRVQWNEGGEFIRMDWDEDDMVQTREVIAETQAIALEHLDTHLKSKDWFYVSHAYNWDYEMVYESARAGLRVVV